MLITVECPACHRRYDVASKLAGKKVRCKGCAETFRVPVPQTLPEPEAKPRRRKRADRSDALAGVFDSGVIAIDASATPTPHQAVGLIPDWGRSWRFFFVKAGIVAVLILAGLLGIGSPVRITVWLVLVGGVFLLLPILGGWASFEETRRARLLGLDGARAAQFCVATALWIFAIMLGLDAIHIAALDPIVEAAAPAAGAREAASDR